MQIKSELRYVVNGRAFKRVEDLIDWEFKSGLLLDVSSKFSFLSEEAQARICDYIVENLTEFQNTRNSIEKAVFTSLQRMEKWKMEAQAQAFVG